MNFLAHLYLSGDDADLKIGNFIGDHIKGKTIHLLPSGVKNGVLLHRKIDTYTDQHPVVMQSKLRLRPEFRKYAPVIADIYYDHFLAVNWDRFSDISLQQYASDFYQLTNEYSHILPARTQHMLSYMVTHNWLVSYSTLEGIHKVLNGMSKRTSFNSGMEKAAGELQINYELYQSEFHNFFADLEKYVLEERKLLKG
ncbi:MAG: acyl carrier protein phosphodiesterase [Bacteroidota bacterium]|nr:acyl carrier protein phosphodiesterase [Bacteroidota bacterium]